LLGWSQAIWFHSFVIPSVPPQAGLCEEPLHRSEPGNKKQHHPFPAFNAPFLIPHTQSHSLMAYTGHVHWHEGLFLQPHHLQWMQRQAVEAQIGERRLRWAYPYGVVEAKLSSDALENMLVRFEKLRLVMPSGVEVNFPDAAELPALDIKQVFKASSQPFSVSLGVPLWSPTGGNTVDVGGGGTRVGSPGDDLRAKVKRIFRVAEITRPDENTGENPQPVMVRKINARLMLDGDDRADMEVVPLLKIVHGSGGKDGDMPRMDPAFIPACMLLGGWPALRDMVRDLVNQIEARRKELVVQLTRGGFSIDTLRGAQFEQIMRLTTLNRFSGSLPSIVGVPGLTPFEMYLQLRELLGELAALRPDKDMFEAARYDHDNPAISFSEVIERIRMLLGEKVEKSYLELNFARETSDGQSYWAATLTDEHITKPNDYFLGIKTKQDSRAVAQLIEDKDQFKMMVWSMRDKRVFGITLAEERHPPTQLPAQVDLHYYRLMRAESVRMWESIKSERKIALVWPGLDTSDFVPKLYMTIPG